MPPRRRPLKKPKAVIGVLANVEATKRGASNVAKEVIERVKNCFARANHPTANEQEARAASKMASKTMEKYGITQADIMAEEDVEERAKRGGISTVNIWPAKDGGRAFTPGWVDWLCGAMQNFFVCRAYSTAHDTKIEWTFYGIAAHTVSAAIAFEAVHNQIQDWSERFTGIPVRNSYCLGVADGLLRLSKEEQEATEARVRQAEANAFAQRIKEEEVKIQQREARLRMTPHPPPVTIEEEEEEKSEEEEEGDKVSEGRNGDEMSVDGELNKGIFDELNDVAGDDSDNEVAPDFREGHQDIPPSIDIGADFETELQNFMPSRPSPSGSTRSHSVSGDSSSQDEHSSPEITKTSNSIHDTIEHGGSEPIDVEENPEWKNMRQLTTFREMSKGIEDQVLKTHKVKLRKGRKRKNVIKDVDAYKEGKKDSRKIEVRAARIEPKADSNMDKMEDDTDRNGDSQDENGSSQDEMDLDY